MSSGTRTLLPPHTLPSSACLLISLGGGRKLSPFLPKRRFSISTLFPLAPPILLCMLFSAIVSLTGLQREKRRGRGIKQSTQLDSPHKRTSELHTIFISCCSFHFSVADTFVPKLKTHRSQQRQRKPFSFKEEKAATSFKGVFALRGGSLSAFSPLIDLLVCLKFAKAAKQPLMCGHSQCKLIFN